MSALQSGMKEKAKAVIHIGLPKCGSTTIQSWMDMNRDAMETRGAWVFDEDPRHLICASIHLALHELGADEETAWSKFRGLRKWGEGREHEIYKDLTAMLEKKQDTMGVFVYSWEALSNKAEEIHIVALDTYLSKFFENRTYVAYIRDTIDLFVSAYSQVLRFYDSRQNSINFQDWMKKCVSNPRPNFEENYFERLIVWKKVLGQSVHVNLLEPDALKNGDLIDDFSYLVGLGPFCKPSKRNESFAAKYIEYIRFMNLELADVLSNMTRRKMLQILTAQSEGKPKLLVSDEQAEAIRESFREKHEKIRSAFFADRPCLFSPKSYGVGIPPTPLTKRRIAAIESEIREIWHTIF